MSQQLALNLSGPARRDRDTARVDDAESEAWKRRADAAIAELARASFGTESTFSAEDVRRIAGDPSRPNAMGARWLAALRAGVVERIGWSTATRPEAHACRLALYRGTAAAERA